MLAGFNLTVVVGCIGQSNRFIHWYKYLDLDILFG